MDGHKFKVVLSEKDEFCYPSVCAFVRENADRDYDENYRFRTGYRLLELASSTFRSALDEAIKKDDNLQSLTSFFSDERTVEVIEYLAERQRIYITYDDRCLINHVIPKSPFAIRIYSALYPRSC